MNTATENAVFIVGTVIIVAGIAVWLVVLARRASRAARASDIRLATDIASLAAPDKDATPHLPASATGSSIAWDTLPWDQPQSEAPAPPAEPAANTLAGRLAELNDLHARKLITDEELAAARAKVLAE
jgi:hypothetical protein